MEISLENLYVDIGSTLHQAAFTPAQKSYQIVLLFTHKNGEIGVISVMETSCAVPIYKVECHISDRFSYLY